MQKKKSGLPIKTLPNAWFNLNEKRWRKVKNVQEREASHSPKLSLALERCALEGQNAWILVGERAFHQIVRWKCSSSAPDGVQSHREILLVLLLLCARSFGRHREETYVLH
mgnify:CR=1 FL=1